MLYPIEESRGVVETGVGPFPAQSPVATEALETPRCAHYWTIEPANGPTRRGVCQFCMEDRDFQNTVEANELFVD